VAGVTGIAKRPLSDATKSKILAVAAEILSMHGAVVGNRMCQDWSGSKDRSPKAVFTPQELDDISYNHEIENSDLKDYEQGVDMMHDEMVASFALADALRDMAGDALR